MLPCTEEEEEEALLYFIIYTIICLKSVCRSTFVDCRSQCLLDRLERCLKLIVSYRGTSSHEFASQFGLEFFIREKTPKPQSARSLTVRATDRQNGATIWKAFYIFTPGGDLRHNSHKGLQMILLAPQNHPSLRESYPRCNDPAKRGSVCADAGLHSQVICTCVSLKFIQITGNS